MVSYKIFDVKRTLADGGTMTYFAAHNGKERTAANMYDLANEIANHEFRVAEDMNKKIGFVYIPTFKTRTKNGCEETAKVCTQQKSFNEYYEEAKTQITKKIRLEQITNL